MIIANGIEEVKLKKIKTVSAYCLHFNLESVSWRFPALSVYLFFPKFAESFFFLRWFKIKTFRQQWNIILMEMYISADFLIMYFNYFLSPFSFSISNNFWISKQNVFWEFQNRTPDGAAENLQKMNYFIKFWIK